MLEIRDVIVQGLPQEKPAVEVSGLPKYAQEVYIYIYYQGYTDTTGQTDIRDKRVEFGED
eukprot:8897519-Ditylum_brightwellii.AAC.1